MDGPMQPSAAGGAGGPGQTSPSTTAGRMGSAPTTTTAGTTSAPGTTAGAGAGAGAAASGTSGGSAGMMAPAEKPTVACATEEEKTFSFFLTSFAALQRESGNPKGFGGNLGGIKGADELCRKIALSSSPCAGNKTWRAFLSTTSEHAIDRIGQGPWHDRAGRVVAAKLADLLADRPTSADPAISNDLPNESGIPNRNPDGMGQVDNHQVLTGSGIDGKLYTQPPGADMSTNTGAAGAMGGRPGGGGAAGGGRPPGGGFGTMTSCDGGWTPEKATCWNWTRADPEGCPRVGHSWPRQGSGVNWISVWNEGGCAAGATLDDRTAPDGMSVGSFGGYGGFYCFALTP